MVQKNAYVQIIMWHNDVMFCFSTLYRKLVKAGRPPPDEPPEGPPLPKPILRFYLVGWGIGMLICGISTAINLNHYDAHPTL